MKESFAQQAAADYAESASAMSTADREKVQARCTIRAKKILQDLKKDNHYQYDMVVDPNTRVSGICPRRAGKTYGGAAAALVTCEAKPGAIVAVICLTLKQLRRNWWLGATSGVPTLAHKYKIPITTNSSELRWEHENGSIGYLLGAETLEQMEYIRGLEADLYIIDEGGSFAPGVLQHLLDDIIEPQRHSRRARVMMIGTPSQIVEGPFYEGTNPEYLDPETKSEAHPKGLPRSLVFGEEPPAGTERKHFVSCHRWTLENNGAQPWLWQEALDYKAWKKWPDNHPTWMRESLGLWVDDGTGLVYEYSSSKRAGADVTWIPTRSAENPTGLPAEDGPWHLVFGLDLGFQDPTALVVAGYSETRQELRHVWDSKNVHLLVDDVRTLIDGAIGQFGQPEIIFADTSNLALMLVETMRARYGYPLEAAEKREKNDHIELMNADFRAGRIKIIPDTDLANQLSSVPWDLSKDTKAALSRAGKLVEDKKVPNDLTDAFLYLYRGCLHHFATQKAKEPAFGTPEYWKKWEADQLARARREARAETQRKKDKLNSHRGPVLGDIRYGRGTPPPPIRRFI